MIKFFKSFRYDLMETGKTRKYFKYAIGEVVLVVIGILIALSINNWNENRKENLFEQKVLKEILADTEEDLKEMNNALAKLKESQESSDFILAYFNKDLPYTASLDAHFAGSLRLWSLSPNSTAFEMAKTEGMYLIKNDSIRFKVAKINGYFFDYLRVLESRWQDYHTTLVLPYCLPLFDYYNFDSMKPTNYETLKTNETYQGILKTLGAMRKRYIEFLELRLEILQELNRIIKTSLND